MHARLLFGLILLVADSVSQAQTTEPLVHEGVVDAPIDTVWSAWTTSEGLRSWLAPHADIDLKIGGLMRTNYADDGDLSDPQTIENAILSFEPLRMLSTRVSRAPDGFPFAGTVPEMWTVIYFESQDSNRTRVRVVSMGFTLTDESQAMRAFFDRGNALTIRQMQERLGGNR